MHAFIPSVAAIGALVGLWPPAPGSLLAQADSQAAGALLRVPRPAPRRAPGPVPAAPEHPAAALITTYDRIADRTRIVVLPPPEPRPARQHGFMSLSAAVVFAGPEMIVAPDTVDLEFYIYSASRGGWSLGRPVPLRITVDDGAESVLEPGGYARLRVRAGDRGRTEHLLVRMPMQRFLDLTSASRVRLRVGRFTLTLDQAGLEPLRTLAGRLTPAGSE